MCDGAFGHITRAAERLGMQQPPLSQRIKAIENEINVQLFRRKPRGVELTETGRAFLDRARATLAHYDGTFEAARSAPRAPRISTQDQMAVAKRYCPLGATCEHFPLVPLMPRFPCREPRGKSESLHNISVDCASASVTRIIPQ